MVPVSIHGTKKEDRRDEDGFEHLKISLCLPDSGGTKRRSCVDLVLRALSRLDPNAASSKLDITPLRLTLILSRGSLYVVEERRVRPEAAVNDVFDRRAAFADVPIYLLSADPGFQQDPPVFDAPQYFATPYLLPALPAPPTLLFHQSARPALTEFIPSQPRACEPQCQRTDLTPHLPPWHYTSARN